MNDEQRQRDRRFRQRFGPRLQQTRNATSITQVTLSQELLVSSDMVSMYERGLHSPTLVGFRDICVALNADADTLLMLDELPRPSVTAKRAAARLRADRALDGASDETLRLVLHVLAKCDMVAP